MQQVAGKQVAGLILSPDWIVNSRRAEPYIREMAEHGYVLVDLFVRHMRQTVLDPEVHDSIAALTDLVHRHGMKCMLDTDHQWWGNRFAEANPDAALWVIGSREVPVYDGRFDFIATHPSLMGQVHFQELSAVFRSVGAGYQAVPLAQIRFDWQHCGAPVLGVQIKGEVANGYSGRLVFYVAFKTYGEADVAHPLYLKAQKQLLEQYADIPLDGFGWDEPGKGMGHMGYFKGGAGFLKFFRRRAGYELRSKLIHLDHLDATPETVKIRCDYYRILNDMNLQAQEEHNRHATKLWRRPDLIFGTHQTWSGIPANLAAGVVDYFRLGRVLTASWTDGSWDVELKYPALHFMLAEGIKKELGLRDAYYNDWTARVPVIEDMRFANRYKMLFNVNWFNIFFSDYSENLVNWRLEPVKSAAQAEIAALDQFDALLGNDFQAHSDVAWLYLYEGIAAAPKWLTRVFYSACANLALHLADSGRFANMMSGASLLRAKLGRGQITVGACTCRAVLVPYAHALPDAVYRRLLEMGEAGITVIFIGPPPEFIAETGEAIGADFASRVGFKPFSFGEYQAAYAARQPLPALMAWEPEWVDFHYPLTVTSGRATLDREERIRFVKAARMPLYYMSQPDPREDVCNLLETVLPDETVKIFASRTYIRQFRDPAAPHRLVLLAVAQSRIADAQVAPSRLDQNRPPRQARELKALIRTGSGELELAGGSWCAVKVEQDQVTAWVGDCPRLCWNGRPLGASPVPASAKPTRRRKTAKVR